jgi:hypothetical protein
MPLFIRDETANTLLLTIDDNGLIAFGSGTPVNQITVNGTAVIDADGNITNQRAGSSAIAAGSGLVSVAPGQTAIVNTIDGVVPTVQLDATWPSIQTTHVLLPFDHCVSTNVYQNCSHKVFGAFEGHFRVINQTAPADSGACPTGIGDGVAYRWM